MEPPCLETRLLVLRVPTPDDAGAMAAFAIANRDHLAPWDPLRSESYARDYLLLAGRCQDHVLTALTALTALTDDRWRVA